MIKRAVCITIFGLTGLMVYSHNRVSAPGYPENPVKSNREEMEIDRQLTMQESLSDSVIISKFTKPSKPKHGFGFSAGWGLPYGYGIEYNHLISNHFDLNVGAGFSFSGLRTGIGTRYYFKNEGSTPFLGTNIIYTSGLFSYTVRINSLSGDFRNFSDAAVFLRGGYQLEQHNISNLNLSHMIAVGYGIPFRNKGAELIVGSSDSTVKKFADMQALGGIEISYTLIFRLDK